MNNLGDWRALEPAGRIALAIGLGWEGEPTVTEADDWIVSVLRIRERSGPSAEALRQTQELAQKYTPDEQARELAQGKEPVREALGIGLGRALGAVSPFGFPLPINKNSVAWPSGLTEAEIVKALESPSSALIEAFHNAVGDITPSGKPNKDAIARRGVIAMVAALKNTAPAQLRGKMLPWALN